MLNQSQAHVWVEVVVDRPSALLLGRLVDDLAGHVRHVRISPRVNGRRKVGVRVGVDARGRDHMRDACVLVHVLSASEDLVAAALSAKGRPAAETWIVARAGGIGNGARASALAEDADGSGRAVGVRTAPARPD